MHLASCGGTSIIPETEEAEVEGSQVRGQPGQLSPVSR